MSIVSGIAAEIFHLFLDMTPYLVLGMFMAGLLHITINQKFIAGHIGSYTLWSVVKSALFGVPLPLCSCGVVPTAVYLKDSGASRPAVIAFLISTPQTGVDSIIAAYGLLGPAMAIIRPIAALFTGVLGGAVSLQIQKKDDAFKTEIVSETTSEAGDHDCGCSLENCSSNQPTAASAVDTSLMGKIKEKIASLFSYGFLEFTNDIAIPFLVGLFIAGVLSFSIPDDFFAGTLAGSGIVGMLIMIAVGIPFYICSTSSIPIAVALILKGVSPGVAFVFLMAGPATNAATLGILKKQFGSLTTMIYLGSITVGSIIFGYIIDMLTEVAGINFFKPSLLSSADGSLGADIAGVLQLVVSAGFLLLLLYSLLSPSTCDRQI